MNTMTCKGQTARVAFDERDNILVGRLLGISDIVGFHAESVAELRAAFEEAFEACSRLGKPAEKPASGKLMLRVPPEVHSAALSAARAAGTSSSQWAAKVLEQAAQG